MLARQREKHARVVKFSKQGGRKIEKMKESESESEAARHLCGRINVIS